MARAVTEMMLPPPLARRERVLRLWNASVLWRADTETMIRAEKIIVYEILNVCHAQELS